MALLTGAIRRATLGAALGVFVMAQAVAAKAETFEVTVATGQPAVFLWVKLLSAYFIPEVDRRLAAMGGQYEIDWTEAYDGTLAETDGVLEAIESGRADMGFVDALSEAAALPLQNVSYMAPFGSADVAAVTGAIVDLQNEMPAMQAAWGRHNQVFLGGGSLDSYQLLTTFPVTGAEDLRGKKILVTGASANWIEGTGAIAVPGTPRTYHDAIETGAADGVVTFISGAWASKVFQVAPHITKVDFGAQFAGGLSINKDTWDSFPPEVRDVFAQVAAAYTLRFAIEQQNLANALLSKMAEAGAQVSALDPAARKRWAFTIPNMAQPWAAELDRKGEPGTEVLKGFITYLEASGADMPRDWAVE